MNGIIVKGIGGFYYVKTADNCIYECKARGIFRKEKITPAVGDRVEIEVNNNNGSIIKISERKNCLIRPSVANIDALIIVVAATSPEPNLFLIDKMIVNAHKNNIEVMICINKSDLKGADDIEKIYTDAGYKVFTVSAKEGSGIDELMAVLKDKITAFAGLSGVGKSSLLNALTDYNAQTGKISEKIQRGKHTTRHVELFELSSGGYIFDTPGFSSFETEDISPEDLWEYFPEMSDAAHNCRFRGCVHINEPDCAVKEKLNDGKISTSRYDSYKEIYKTLKDKKGWIKK